jgi:SAM-dependent methyltransferase
MPSEHYTRSFYENLRAGVVRSAEAIAPLAYNLFHPHSVVDVGCGDGTWLAVFQKLGAQEILGIDGDYVEHDLLQIPSTSFQPVDLTKPFDLGRTFDLAVSLEVAEHLPADCAPAFIESLTRLAPAILFSAAIPFQGGVHHVNEQWPDKWAALFRELNYVPVDCIRKRVWRNEAVDWWYAQNTLLFVKPTLLESNAALKAEAERTNLNQLGLVHPRNYLDAFVPLEPPPWGVKTSFELFRTCITNLIRRRLSSVFPENGSAPVTNPPNFNLVLQDGIYYGICKRQSRD